MNAEREMLKLESLNREEETESLKLEERVYLDFRDLKSEELNLKWVLGRCDIEKKKSFNKILEDVGNIKMTGSGWLFEFWGF